MDVLEGGILRGLLSCLFELSFNHRVGACILRYLGGGHRKFYFFGLVSQPMGALGGDIRLGPQLSWRLFRGGLLMLREQE